MKTEESQNVETPSGDTIVCICICFINPHFFQVKYFITTLLISKMCKIYLHVYIFIVTGNP